VTASLPADVQAVFDRFITSELTTIDRSGQPVTWAVTPYYRPGDPCIDVTTGLGFPQKAQQARTNPLVALLFSDPAGSGVEDPPMVLVQGTAQVDDRDLDANRERYARESFEKLPGVRRLEPPAPLRRLLGWYYTRIYIHVRPERVYVWPRGDISSEPRLFDAHMEEVRSGHSEEPERYHATPSGGASTWHARIAQLGTRYPTAVLSLVSPDGFPFAVRVPVHVDEAARWIRIEGAPTGVPFQPGLACLTPRAREERFSSHQEFQLRGDLVFADGSWALIPHQVLGGRERAQSRLAVLGAGAAKLRRFRRAAKRELAGRG
jgi:hypothetical protein